LSRAVPRHRGPCLPVVCRPQGFSRPTSPLSRPGVATRSDPMLSWASFPFRVLPSRSACIRSARTGPARTRGRPSLVLPCNRGLDSKLSVALAGVICRILNWIAPEPCTTPDRHRRSDLPWAFRLLCTSQRANAQEDSQVNPSKTTLRRLVAFFLYFGFQNTRCLRCCDRPLMSGHHAWPWVAEAPQFPARIRRLSYFYRRAKRSTKQRTQRRNRCFDLLP
jgi:hypothetical protein